MTKTMNVLFISLELIKSIENRGLYTDLLREIRSHGHNVTSISAIEKRDWAQQIPAVADADGITYIHVRTGNITKNKNFIEKGLSMVKAGYQYSRAIKNYSDKKFDLVICTTPIITFETAVRYVKRKNEARTVLLLKDIWPYDLLFEGVLSKKGLKGLAYRYLERIAEKLFEASDLIGCMTPVNKKFLEEVYNDGKKMDNAIIIPNSIEPTDLKLDAEEIREIKRKYRIPEEKILCVYGGNLGVAQGPEFIIESIEKATRADKEFFFAIFGNGTEAERIGNAFKDNENVLVMNALNYDEYNRVVRASDIGLVYLNWECKTPNVPSRMLQYMDAAIPLICATDDVTDAGQIAEDNGFGIKCSSNNAEEFTKALLKLKDEKIRRSMGQKARDYLENEWSARAVYELIF